MPSNATREFRPAASLESRILVLAPTGRDAELSCAFLSQAGMGAIACEDMADLSARLGEGAGAVLLAEEALGPKSVEILIERIASQPSWSAIPICVITSGGQATASVLRKLISARGNGHVTILARPFRTAILLNAMEVARAARQRQYQVRQLLTEKESILASINDAFVTFDKDLRYTFVNPKAAEFAGKSPSEMLGRSFAEVNPSLRGSKVEKTLLHALEKKELSTIEFLQPSSGSWFHQRVYPSPQGISVFTADLTDRKRVETELAEARQQLEKHARDLEEQVRERTASLQETNAQLEAFCYTIAHDLRGPLRAQQGFAEALLEDHRESLNEEGRGYAERIIGAARRLDALVGDLLDYARISRADIKRAPLDLEALVRETCADLDLKPAPGGLHLGPLGYHVWGHAITLKTALTNLLSNARKFRHPDRPVEIRIGAEEREGWVRLSIQDNGIGIAQAHLEQIFGVFHRLHRAERYPGTGVGLAIVQKVVDRMGGRVGVESEEGEGSRFWIELKSADAVRHTRPPDNPESPGTRRF